MTFDEWYISLSPENQKWLKLREVWDVATNVERRRCVQLADSLTTPTYRNGWQEWNNACIRISQEILKGIKS